MTTYIALTAIRVHPAETRLTVYRRRQVQELAELVGPRRRRATIGENDMKFDSFIQNCEAMSPNISIFRLV